MKQRNWHLIFGVAFLAFIAFISIFGPHFPNLKPELESVKALINDDGSIRRLPFSPSLEYPLGTDRTGGDMLSRLIIGLNEVLVIILGITFVRYLISIPLGFMSYYYKAANWVLEIWNKFFSFVPSIFMIIIVLNIPYIYYAPNRYIWIIIIIALLEVGRVAEVTRSQVETIAQKEYITAAIASGTSEGKLFRKYYFPALLPELAINMILDFSRNLFVIGQLGIIQIFISYKTKWNFENLEYGRVYQSYDDVNSWPIFLQNIGEDIWLSEWIPLATCGAIVFLVLGFFVFAEGLRKHFNKRQSYF
ncbi:ABC transporter permease [Bacillaceae bacterium W0354]